MLWSLYFTPGADADSASPEAKEICVAETKRPVSGQLVGDPETFQKRASRRSEHWRPWKHHVSSNGTSGPEWLPVGPSLGL